MPRPLGFLLHLAGIILVAAPLSILATLLLFPFWSWFEATTSIEAVGHSGPAQWCYAVAFLLFVASGVWLLLPRATK